MPPVDFGEAPKQKFWQRVMGNVAPICPKRAETVTRGAQAAGFARKAAKAAVAVAAAFVTAQVVENSGAEAATVFPGLRFGFYDGPTIGDFGDFPARAAVSESGLELAARPGLDAPTTSTPYRSLSPLESYR